MADLLDLIDGEVLIVLVEMLRVAQLQIGAGVLGDEGETLRDLVKGADRRALDHERCCAVSARTHFLHVDADLIIVHIAQRVEILLHAPVEKEADSKLIGVARVCCGGAARDVAREVFVKVGDEIFRRDGVLPDVHRHFAHAAHISRCRFRPPRRDTHLRRRPAAVGFVCRQKITPLVCINEMIIACSLTFSNRYQTIHKYRSVSNRHRAVFSVCFL